GGLAEGFVDLANAVVGLVVEPNGRISVASDGCFVARYLPDGSPDFDFGFQGIGGYSKCVEATGFARQPGGGLLLCGRSDDRMAVARMKDDGTADDGFGTDGLAGVDDWPISNVAALRVLPDGRFALAGSGTPEIATHAALARFLSNGAPDPSFGMNGHRLVEIGEESAFSAVVDQPDGRLVAAGFRTNGLGRNLVLFRCKVNGDPDPTFGEAGFVFPALDFDPDQPLALAWEKDAKIVVAGARQTLVPDAWGGLIPTHEFVAAAFNANGTLDASYGTGGVMVVDLGDRTDDLPRSVAFDPLERAVIAGASSGFIGIVRLRTGATTSVPDGVADRAPFELGQVVPNPMRGRAALDLVLSNSARVRADVFDPTGRRVRALVEDELRAGSHVISWDGRDDAGRPVSGGVYFVRVDAGGVPCVRRVTVVE
ncbi:MAG TPA: FlgD immunoglobulin-like domain containing protein, partial [Candidatus Eisenbacteria bacterium]